MIAHQNPSITAPDAYELIVTARHDGSDWNTTGTLLTAGGQEIQIQEFITDWPLDSAYLTAAFGVASLEMVTASRADDPADRVRYRVTPRHQVTATHREP